MAEHKIIANNGSSIVLYTTEGGNTQLEVKIENDLFGSTESKLLNFMKETTKQ